MGIIIGPASKSSCKAGMNVCLELVGSQQDVALMIWILASAPLQPGFHELLNASVFHLQTGPPLKVVVSPKPVSAIVITGLAEGYLLTD